MTREPAPAGGTALPPESVPSLVRRFIGAEPHELSALLLSFAMFFCVLCGYYILRPVRDEMGVALGSDALEKLFLVVFLVMLAAVPVFGAIVRALPRDRVVPAIYLFFILNLAVFWITAGRDPAERPGPLVASVFFVWGSVFNLFVVSLFWSLMSFIWESAAAKRLYGFIAAGGTAGAVSGPIVASLLAGRIATNDLLAVAALFLTLALLCSLPLSNRAGASTAEGEQPAGARDIFSGAVRVWQSPHLFRIAAFIFIANIVGTFFYLEQSRIVGEAISDRAERVAFFANRDVAVSLVTIGLQMLVTGRVMSRLGLTLPLLALPISATLGLLALAISPTLDVIAAIMVVERAIGFAFTNPAIKVLYTGVDPDEKFKAQNFVDTVVYRGGDAAAGWIFNSLAKPLGLGGAALAIASVPLAIIWVGTSVSLARSRLADGTGTKHS